MILTLLGWFLLIAVGGVLYGFLSAWRDDTRRGYQPLHTATPPAAVPPSYFSRANTWFPWFSRWWLPRCPRCHGRYTRALERHGSFQVYTCRRCSHQWRDVF